MGMFTLKHSDVPISYVYIFAMILRTEKQKTITFIDGINRLGFETKDDLFYVLISNSSFIYTLVPYLKEKK
jgi:hypothetical protein